MGMLDAIYNHFIKKLPVTAGKLGELDPHSPGRNRVIRPMYIYPDYFGINRKTTICVGDIDNHLERFFRLQGV